MTTRLYTPKEVNKLTGANAQKIQYWVLNRLFAPYDPSSGTGTTRRYSYQNILEITLIQTVSSLTRLHLDIVKAILNEIREERPQYFQQSAEESWVEQHKNVLVLRASSRQTVAIVNLFTHGEAVRYLSDMLGEGYLLLSMDLDVLKSGVDGKLVELNNY
jgi:DNA-binding transcriptional MerR regulator